MTLVKLSIFLIAGLWMACREQKSPLHSDAGSDLRVVKQQVLSQYASLALARYDDAVNGVLRLETAVGVFIRKPSEAALKDAQKSWLDARSSYLQTEAFRFYGGPIDALEPFINAWPIDENFIDTGVNGSGGGIVGDPTRHPDLSSEKIAALNESEGETSISTGFHAIEFLLWGQDVSATGPGQRSFRDFLPRARNAIRRSTYLKAVTTLLAGHLQTVRNQWRPSSPSKNYVTHFLGLPPDEALSLAFKGLGVLVGPELGGERLTVSYETKDQEDEHSCFSDNTHNDILGDLLGVDGVLHGGTASGLAYLVALKDPTIGRALDQGIRDALAAARSIPIPFDQSIRGGDAAPGRQAVALTIKRVRALADVIGRSAAVLGLVASAWELPR